MPQPAEPLSRILPERGIFMAFSNNKEDGGLDFFDLDEDLTADLEDEDGGSIDTGWD